MKRLKKKLSESQSAPQDIPQETASTPSVEEVQRKIREEYEAECRAGKLPDPPLHHEEIPNNNEVISQAELGAVAEAEWTLQIARADCEKKRAAVTLKLLLLCDVEGKYGSDDGLDAELDEDGKLHILDTCGSCRTRGPHYKILAN